MSPSLCTSLLDAEGHPMIGFTWPDVRTDDALSEHVLEWPRSFHNRWRIEPPPGRYDVQLIDEDGAKSDILLIAE